MKNQWPWLLEKPLVLASGSSTRRDLLVAAGIFPEIIRPSLDEREIENPLRASGMGAADRALMLARAKTLDVAARHKNRVVIGADQTLQAPDHPGIKAVDQAEAMNFLMRISGIAHQLHSAWCIAAAGVIIAEGVDTAVLHGRAYDAKFIAAYVENAGDSVLQSVGCYQLEGLGQHLFEHIAGDQSTILGLPMMPVLDFLRRRGMVAA